MPTLGEFRAQTAHLPDDTPIDAWFSNADAFLDDAASVRVRGFLVTGQPSVDVEVEGYVASDEDDPDDDVVGTCVPCGYVGPRPWFRIDDPDDSAEFRCPKCRSEQVGFDEDNAAGEYLYRSAAACRAAGDHLLSVDASGFCDACGEQEDTAAR